MNGKSQQVRHLVEVGDFRNALRIAKDFHLGISKFESDLMKRGYEAMLYPDFYKSLGVDIDRTVRLGIATVKCLYGA